MDSDPNPSVHRPTVREGGTVKIPPKSVWSVGTYNNLEKHEKCLWLITVSFKTFCVL